ncbi:hypothetical protein A6E02_18995 [Aliivibrio fischeri]|nr:hypothetical protein A6E02_18995 [Aliivibrio fischeri]
MVNECAYVPFSCVFNGSKMSHTMNVFVDNASMYCHSYLVCLVKEDGEQLHVLGGLFIKTNLHREDEAYPSMLTQYCLRIDGFDEALSGCTSFLSLKLKIEGVQTIYEKEGISLMKYQYQQLTNHDITLFKGVTHSYSCLVH